VTGGLQQPLPLFGWQLGEKSAICHDTFEQVDSRANSIQERCRSAVARPHEICYGHVANSNSVPGCR
jgi:hypothetical protein